MRKEHFKKNSLALLLLSIALIAAWRWMWGVCWNPFETASYSAVGGGDAPNHYYGWLAYAKGITASIIPPAIDSWTWPIIVPLPYFDTIPFASILFRPVYQLIQADFQYFSLLSLVSMLFSGLLGYRIGRLRTNSFGCAIALGLFLGLAPVAIYRFWRGHEALGMQCLLVYAFYLLIRRDPSLFKWGALIFVTLGTHAYLAGIIAPFIALRLTSPECPPSGIAQRIYHTLGGKMNRSVQRGKIADGLLYLIIAVAAMYVYGYFIGGMESSPNWGDNWSANILALVDSANYSYRVPPMKRHMPFQHEGFSYLGLFVILAGLGIILRSLVRGKRAASPVPEDPQSLFPSPKLFWAIACLLVIFSWGLDWYWGATKVLSLHWIDNFPLLAKPYYMFRSTGRFMWPAYYAITISVTCSLWRCFSSRWARKILLIVFVASLLETHLLTLKIAKIGIHKAYLSGTSYQSDEYSDLGRIISSKDTILVNLTGQANLDLPAIPPHLLQKLNPLIRTNYHPWLGRYPKSFEKQFSADLCASLSSLLKEHKELEERGLFLASRDQVNKCGLPGFRIETLLAVGQDISIYRLRKQP